MANLIAVQLETNHFNSDGCAWYAYFDGEPDVQALRADPVFQAEVRRLVNENGAPLGLLNDSDFNVVLDEEAPTDLSHHAGLRRYYLDGAA